MKYTIMIEVEITEASQCEDNDNAISMAVERAVGQLTGFHYPEVIDIMRTE